MHKKPHFTFYVLLQTVLRYSQAQPNRQCTDNKKKCNFQKYAKNLIKKRVKKVPPNYTTNIQNLYS
jgi:hypothetical protein